QMILTLFTGDECPPCTKVEEAFKKRYKEEIGSGEADIVNLDENEAAQQFWAEHDLPLAPVMVVTTDSGKLISVIEAEEIMEKTPSSS
ncbi:unnamed protein product, partial [marine sediment metagenome]